MKKGIEIPSVEVKSCHFNLSQISCRTSAVQRAKENTFQKDYTILSRQVAEENVILPSVKKNNTIKWNKSVIKIYNNRFNRARFLHFKMTCAKMIRCTKSRHEGAMYC